MRTTLYFCYFLNRFKSYYRLLTLCFVAVAPVRECQAVYHLHLDILYLNRTM